MVFKKWKMRTTVSAPSLDTWNRTDFTIGQCSPPAFDLRGILKKCDNLRAAANKMKDWTTYSQDLKLKKEDIKWVHHWSYYTRDHQPFWNCELVLVYRLMRRATSLVHTCEIKILLNLPSIILLLIFVNVKTFVMLMLFLEQARGRPGAHGRHVGDPCITQHQIAICFKFLTVECLWPRLFWHYCSYINTTMWYCKSDNIVQCFVCYSVYIFKLGFLPSRVAYFHTRHTDVLPNIECRNLSVCEMCFAD